MFARTPRPRRVGIAGLATLALATTLATASSGMAQAAGGSVGPHQFGAPLTSSGHLPAATSAAAPGTVYVADSNRVVAVAADGSESIVGSDFSEPMGVAATPSGDVIVADAGAGVVYDIAPDGSQTALPFTGLDTPWNVAVDNAGDVYVTDIGNDQVLELTPSGTQRVLPFTGLTSPYGVAVDDQGNVYVTDGAFFEDDSTVQKLTPAGLQSTVGSGYFFAVGVDVSPAGDVYVADLGYSIFGGPGGAVYRIAPDGTQTEVPLEGLQGPTDVVVDTSGNLFVTEYEGSNLFEYSADGVQSVRAGDVSGFGVGTISHAGHGQAISFSSAAPGHAAVGERYPVATVGGASGSRVTLTADPSSAGVCTVTDEGDGTATVRLTGAGSCVVDANQSGRGIYLAAPQVQQGFAVKYAQAITFTAKLSTPRVGKSATVTATGGTSGQPVVFAKGARSGNACTVSATGQVSYLHAKPCIVVATQAGDATHYAAARAFDSIHVKRAVQHVRFTTKAPKHASHGTTYQAKAKGGHSPYPLRIVVSGACTVDGKGLVTFRGHGTCTIGATRAGNQDYLAGRATQQTKVR